MMGVSIHLLMDLTVAGFSLMIGFGIFAFVASILCSAAFFHNAKGHSSDATASFLSSLPFIVSTASSSLHHFLDFAS
ncbi:hypothetical protein L2E82_44624 [Cichorium intybus]|uniref:Uncharacterized protein n=1 Tax=Cichorium intybus TaxID=13427 RepID=A0ACB8ZQM3_CICIN|nr:hypothetical protein L2E82_44624 [Cichorium intybus]